MSLRPSTSTSEHGPAPIGRAGLRRSLTLPSNLINSPRTQKVDIGAAEGIETLFVHPSTKVVSFSSTSFAKSRPSSRSSIASVESERDGAGTSPWSSPTERTMAAGPLQIYRVPGSVSFLHSGNLLHAILPRSQCWCVDGVSKFAIRILANTYYRIELPANTQEDLDLVEQLKTTLAKVLYYERSSCPFQRAFEDDLPEMPSSNVRRMSRQSIEPAKRWRLDKVWRPEGAQEEENQYLRPDRIYYSDTDRSEPEESGKEDSTLTQEEQQSPKQEQPDQLVRPRSRDKQPNLSEPVLSKKLTALRSITVPPQLSLHSSPPSKVRRMAGLFNQASRETTPTRPPLATLTSRLPPTPESMQDEFVGSLSREPIGLSSDESGPENSFSDEPIASIEHEPLIIIEEPERESSSETQPTWPIILLTSETQEDISDVKSPTLQEQTPVHETEEQSTSAGAEQQGLSDVTEEHTPLETAKENASSFNAGDMEVENMAHLTLSEITMIPGAQPQPIPTTNSDPQTPLSRSPTPSTSSHDSWHSLPILTPAEASDLLRQRRLYTAEPSASASASASTSTSSPSNSSVTHTLPQKHTHKRQPSTQVTQSLTLSQTPILLFRKTFTLFLGPPAHLVATMLRIAAKLVASGALNLTEHGTVLDVGERIRGHRRVPGSWDLSDDDEEWGL